MKELKRYIIRKYVMATSVQNALAKESEVKPDDIILDKDWVGEGNQIGFGN